MTTEQDLERLRRNSPDRQFLIHDGYCPWVYGVPMNPTEVSVSTAKELLNHIPNSKSNLLEELKSQGPPPVQYAEQGDNLYDETEGNRFITLMKPSRCIYESDDNPFA